MCGGSWRCAISWGRSTHWSRPKCTFLSPQWSFAGAVAASPDTMTSETSSCTESARRCFRSQKLGSKRGSICTTFIFLPSSLLHRPVIFRPRWRSLILQVDMKTHSGWFVGKDRLIKLMHLLPCFIIGIWRVRHQETHNAFKWLSLMKI